MRVLLPLTVALVAGGATMHAQATRELTAARYYTAQPRLTVHLALDAGNLTLRAATDRALYRFQVRYAQDRFTPIARYDEGTGVVTLGLQRAKPAAFFASLAGTGDEAGTIDLSPRLPLILDGTIGPGAADLDLGGLQLTRLDLSSTADKTTLRFSAPSPTPCEGAIIRTRASETALLQLGNSRCRALRIETEAGPTLLDFSGTYPDSVLRLSVAATLGTVRLQIPAGIGVRLTLDHWMATVEQQGFVRNGTAWVTPGFAAAVRRIELDLKAAAGSVVVEWK